VNLACTKLPVVVKGLVVIKADRMGAVTRQHCRNVGGRDFSLKHPNDEVAFFLLGLCSAHELRLYTLPKPTENALG
jgi:hypothetical protein